MAGSAEAEVPARVEVRSGEGLVLTWEDGSRTELDARRLRAACQCATCRDPAGREAIRAVLEGDRPVRIADARLVGAYAVNLTFEPDGHRTGIFSFALLRELGRTG